LVVGALQCSGVPEPPRQRLEKIALALSDAARRGVRLAVLPEVAVTGYALDAHGLRHAEPVPGPIVFELAAMARRHDLVVVAGCVERSGNDFFDTAVVVDPSGYRGRYRKVHVSAVENAYWVGGSGARPIDTMVGRIGIGLCADMAYRTPWECYRDEEVDLIAVGSAWPDLRRLRPFSLGLRMGTLHHDWTRMLPEKISTALGVPVVYANYCGPLSLRLPLLGTRVYGQFAGGSRIVQRGTIAEAHTEGWTIAEVEVGRREPQAATWNGPWLPNATAWQRGQMYLSDKGLGHLSRFVYRLRAIRRADSDDKGRDGKIDREESPRT